MGLVLTVLLGCGETPAGDAGSDGATDAGPGDSSLIDSARSDASLDANLDAAPDGSVAAVRCADCDNLDPDGIYDVALLAGRADVFTPTSAADLADPARVSMVAVLSMSFDVSGATFASGLTLVPDGGALTGTDVDLNGATIIENGRQAFDPALRFSALYTSGCLSPEMFGAGASDEDADAIEAMIVNGENAIGAAGATYRFSASKTFDRGGVFRWNGNGAVIEARLSSGPHVYMMTWDETRHEICDLEIDGNDEAERLMHVIRSDFLIDGVNFHHFRTEQTDERAIMYLIDLETEFADDFQVIDSQLHDVVARGFSVNPLDVTGVTRQLWIRYLETNRPASFLIRNSELYNTLGNNSDAIQLAHGSGDFEHEVDVLVEDSRFWGNGRRDIKCQTEGLRVHRSSFEKGAPNREAPYGAIPTASISFALNDTPSPADFHDRAEVLDSTFTDPHMSNSSFIGLTHARRAVVRGKHPHTARAAAFGSRSAYPRQAGREHRRGQHLRQLRRHGRSDGANRRSVGVSGQRLRLDARYSDVRRRLLRFDRPQLEPRVGPPTTSCLRTTGSTST